MIVKSAVIEGWGPRMKTGVHQSLIRAYMDDLTVTTASIMRSRWILCSLEKPIMWARMKFKHAKSRSFVMKRGKRQITFIFQYQEQQSLPCWSVPWRAWERFSKAHWKTPLLSDLELWLTKVDKSWLPGHFKVWIYKDSLVIICLWLPNDNSGSHGKEN